MNAENADSDCFSEESSKNLRPSAFISVHKSKCKVISHTPVIGISPASGVIRSNGWAALLG